MLRERARLPELPEVFAPLGGESRGTRMARENKPEKGGNGVGNAVRHGKGDLT